MKTLIKIITFLPVIFVLLIKNLYSEEKIKIGLIVPLTGEYGLIGDSILKSTRLAVNKIDDKKIEIFPRDTQSNPLQTLEVSKELYKLGINIIIGPVFNENVQFLNQLKEVTFLSFTNKINENPKNVISSGVNAISQIQTIKKLQNELGLERSIFLIPNSDYKSELEKAIEKTRIQIKDKFIYDIDPTVLTGQIEELTKYTQRKDNLLTEIKRLEDSGETKNISKIENLKKKDTLGSINFDSVIIGDFDENLKSVATSLLYTDVSSQRVTYITLNQWFDETLIKETSLHPIYFPSVNKKNYDDFKELYFNTYEEYPNQVSFLSYDLIGLIYFLANQNDFKLDKKIFFNKNKFKGKIGIFEINKNTITHQLNLYAVDEGKFKKIF
tara:strand:+ start:1841 stop:2992 length:1152 start_codon:yes stop_codon:yes gene_type:complete